MVETGKNRGPVGDLSVFVGLNDCVLLILFSQMNYKGNSKETSKGTEGHEDGSGCGEESYARSRC